MVALAPVVLWLVLATVGADEVTAPPTQDPGDATGTLIDGIWRGTALGRTADGRFLLLVDEEGRVRLELARGSALDLHSLLARRGDGWTVVTDKEHGGTRNAWGQQWQSLDRDLAALVAGGAAAVAGTPDGGAASRHVVLQAESSMGLRRRLVQRGRGRGGPGEVLRIRGEKSGEITITGTRRPGRLELGSLRRQTILYPRRETFVTIWSLADLLVLSP